MNPLAGSMSSPSLTLQCRQCSGIFAAPKVEFGSLIQCPHCATAAPFVEFGALQEGTRESTTNPVQQKPAAAPESPAPAAGSKGKREGSFQVRGKWLQFDCPHCVRPMRLVVEDAGGLVDCAHCGLELIAPDPAIGRGAKLSRASEGRVGSISRYNLRDLRGDQLKHSKAKEGDDDWEEEFDDDFVEEEEELDPNHALARNPPAEPKERKRAVKALDVKKVGKSFRRQEVIAEQAIAASDTDWEPHAAPRPAFGESHQDKRGFWIAAGIAAIVMFGVVAMVIREASNSGKVFDDDEISEIELAQRAQKAQFDASFATAKQALASPDWESLVPHVRSAERVAPLMRSYYASNPYTPLEVVDYHAPVAVEIGGLPMHEIRVTEASGEMRTLVIQPGSDGPKLDWELYVDLPRHRWGKFLEARPTQPHTVHVIAARASILDRYFDDAGIDREDALGLRLWQNKDYEYYVILPKESELAETMLELLEWDKGRKLIIDASFPAGSELNDRLNIDAFKQTGWVIK